MRFGKDIIPLQYLADIIGVEVDLRLRLDSHLQNVAHKASQVTLLRIMKHLLHSDGLMTFSMAQVRSVMEYTFLTSILGALWHFNLLDKVQRGTENLLGNTNSQPTLKNQRQQSNRDGKQMEQTTPRKKKISTAGECHP